MTQDEIKDAIGKYVWGQNRDQVFDRLELILERIDEHAWDGTPAGRHGPFAMPALPIVAGTMPPAIERHERRRAG